MPAPRKESKNMNSVINVNAGIVTNSNRAVSSVNLMEASNQWMNRPADQRFQSLGALRDSVHNRRLRSRSVDVDLTRIHADASSGKLVINSAISPVSPTHWGFTQLAGWVKAPAGYLRRLPVDLTAQCLNDGIKKADRETLKFMTLAKEGTGDLAAVTSQTYGRIWDADVIDAAGRIVERSGGKFHNPMAYARDDHGRIAYDLSGKPLQTPSGLYASDHDCFIFMIDGGSRLEIGPRAKLNRGFFMWNSEVGARSFGLTTFLFNEVCGNHIVWSAQNVNKLVIRHTQGGPYRFDSEAFPTLRAYCEASAQPEIDAITRAQTASLRNLANVERSEWEDNQAKAIAKVASARGVKLTAAEINGAIETANKEEGQCETVWDLVQGLTAYARGFDFIDSRVDLETRAGGLLRTV